MASLTTDTQQRTQVGEGLALGVLASGIDAITSSKMSVELAFQHAWQRWADAVRYPKVHATLARNDIYFQIIGRSERRRMGIAAWRNEQHRITDGDSPVNLLVPYVVGGESSVEEYFDLLLRLGAPDRGSWMRLADLFLDDLAEEKFAFRANE